MNDLRTAAQQALEALEYAQQGRECPSTTRQAIAALRAALAQKEEPVEPVQDQRCRAEPRSDGDFVCDCKIGDCPGRSAALAQQAEPVEPVATLIAQRDALLEVLKYLDKKFRQHGRQHWPEAVAARLAIEAVEEQK